MDAQVFPIIQRDSEGGISCLLSWEQITARIISFMISDAPAVNSESSDLYGEWERPYYLHADYRSFFRVSRKNAGKSALQQEEGLAVSIVNLLYIIKPLIEYEIGIFEEQTDDLEKQEDQHNAIACIEMYDADRMDPRCWNDLYQRISQKVVVRR